MTTGGDPVAAAMLAEAFRAAESPAEGTRPLTHGFHTYPARMPPATAGAILDAFAEPGDSVADPFCGGGTVLLEARLRGHGTMGLDLQPLAVRIARVRTDPGSERDRGRLVSAARWAVSAARAGGIPPFRLPRSECAWYAPHVLAELAALRGALSKVARSWVRERLLIAFSSIVVKAAFQRADTSTHRVDKAIARGAPSRWFLRRVDELAAGLGRLAASLSRPAPPVRLVQGDVRDLHRHLRPRSLQLVVTSPPYGGTYDYVSHHERRYPWLGIDPKTVGSREIGARRDAGRSSPSVYDDQVAAYLAQIRRALDPGGRVVLLLGDACWAGRSIDAREQIARVGAEEGFVLRAWARQPRVDPRRGPDRHEYLLFLEPRSRRG